MNQIGVVVLLCLVSASSCSKNCQDISSTNQSTTLNVREQAELVLAEFSDEVSVTGTAPEGMVLTNNAGKLVLSGTPTRTGDFTYVITPKTLKCLEYPGNTNPVTEFTVSVSVRGDECAPGPTPPIEIEQCLPNQVCENEFYVCNEGGLVRYTTLPTRSLIRFAVEGDGHSEVTIRQYWAWFASTSESTVAPFNLIKATPAAGETLRGWFFTHDNTSFANAPELKIENLDPTHASNVHVTYSVTGFERGGALNTSGTINTPFTFNAPTSPLLIADQQHTLNFQFSLAEPAIVWNLAVNDGCDHPGMTGAQDYAFFSDLDVGLWSVTTAPVNVAANYRVAVRQLDGGVLSDGVVNPFTFSVHEAQRVNIRVTPVDASGNPLIFSSTCAFDGGAPPSIEWGGPQRMQLELLSPDAG